MSVFSQGGNNVTPMNGWSTYTPVLQGATDNPVATYGTKVGRYYILGNICFYQIFLTTTTMTKTTLTDVLRITLPIVSATVTGAVWQGLARVENTTPIPNPTYAEVASANAFVTARALAAAGNASLPLTYAVASPGIGVLTNTITYNLSGFYEFSQA